MAQQHLKIVRLVMTVTMKWRDSEYLGGVFVRVGGGGGCFGPEWLVKQQFQIFRLVITVMHSFMGSFLRAFVREHVFVHARVSVCVCARRSACV